jgi:hypothetical protein
MAAGIDEILDTARNGTETIFDGIKGFRDAFATGESRVVPKPPDYGRIAMFAGVGVVAVVALVFIARKL